MRLLKQIWMILSLDCEDSARLTSESMDRPLNWAETIAVKLHRMICSKSRRLNRQMLQLHEAVKKGSSRPSHSESFATGSGGLSADARSRIQQAIRDADQR